MKQRTYAERVHEAVNDEEWQKFRRSLKGLSTETKVAELAHYWRTNHGVRASDFDNLYNHSYHTCYSCIRVDNYIKALCRGGQLFAGESLHTMVDSKWNPTINK